MYWGLAGNVDIKGQRGIGDIRGHWGLLGSVGVLEAILGMSGRIRGYRKCQRCLGGCQGL